MTRPSITLIEGTHITAADKRNILDCIAYLVAQINSSGTYELLQWCSRGGSTKAYQITKEPKSGVYTVAIRANETTDHGQPTQRTMTVIVEARGVAHLPNLADYVDLIKQAHSTELTPTGEQYVIPGCERNLSPATKQLDLF